MHFAIWRNTFEILTNTFDLHLSLDLRHLPGRQVQTGQVSKQILALTVMTHKMVNLNI